MLIDNTHLPLFYSYICYVVYRQRSTLYLRVARVAKSAARRVLEPHINDQYENHFESGQSEKKNTIKRTSEYLLLLFFYFSFIQIHVAFYKKTRG